MAVNLIDSNDITISKTGDNIQLNTSVNMQNVQTQSQTNATDINNLKSGEVYSTTEVKTNKVWIDGKSIYRKVIDITSYYPNGISAGSQVTFQHNISNFNNLINARIIRTGSNPLEHKSLSYIQYITDNSRNEFNIYAGNLGIGKTSGQSFYLIVEYTKSS